MVILYIYLGMLITWMWYLATMMLKLKRDKGMKFTIEQKAFGYPMMIAGLAILDAIVMNIIIGTIMFVELPREWLFTTRCQRHMRENTFRGKIARWACRHFLDPFEIGGHC